jgi:hypothetical protein
VPVVKYLPAVGALLLAVLFAVGATRTSKLECDRTSCTRDDVRFRVADVREVRFVDGFGKNKNQAESQIIFANGHQLSVGRADSDDARVIHERLRAFFAPDGPPSLVMKSSGSPWLFVLAAACAIAAVVLGVQARKKLGTYRTPDQKRADWQKRKKYVLAVVAALVVIAGIQAAIMFIAGKVQGTLVLECKQRCRFDGIECLPGGSSRQTLDEGTYQIEIWASSGSALWIPKQFQITKGETTRFVCE